MESGSLVYNVEKHSISNDIIVTDCRSLKLLFVLILTGLQEAHVWGSKMKENLTLVRLELKVILNFCDYVTKNYQNKISLLKVTWSWKFRKLSSLANVVLIKIEITFLLGISIHTPSQRL